MNNILEDVKELKQDIINSNEFKNYNKYYSLLEENEEVNNLISQITTKQKDIVKMEAVGKTDVNLASELDSLYDKLNSIDDYKKYIESSEKLNRLVSNVQMNFEEYFNSLIS